LDLLKADFQLDDKKYSKEIENELINGGTNQAINDNQLEYLDVNDYRTRAENRIIE
jgi:hypothetical protein